MQEEQVAPAAWNQAGAFLTALGGKCSGQREVCSGMGDLGEMGETNEENCQPQLREPSPPGKAS